jgi:hypothetical protein
VSLTLREEHRCIISENRVLRRIFGPKGEEVAGGWRRLHNEELHNLYGSTNIVRVIKSRMKWVGHAARMRERREMRKNVDWKGGREESMRKS